MLNISILGLEDGEHDCSATCDAQSIPDMFPEFKGVVNVKGKIKKQGKRLMLTATASAIAHLICDVSGEEFEQSIEAPVHLVFRMDSQLFSLKGNDHDGDEILLRDDEEQLDITDEVRQELAIHLPMKRVAPEYAHTSFEALHPELLDTHKSVKDDEESPFAALKHLNIHKN